MDKHEIDLIELHDIGTSGFLFLRKEETLKSLRLIAFFVALLWKKAISQVVRICADCLSSIEDKKERQSAKILSCCFCQG